MSELASRYAKAIFSLAPSEEVLKDHLEVLETLASTLKKHPEIFQFFSSPQIDKSLKQDVLEKSLKTRIDPLLLQSLFLLLEKRHFTLLPEITRTYHQLVAEKFGILEALLVTAIPLEANERDALINKLQDFYQKKITVNEKVDPHLIGGGFLMICNKLLDFSIKGKIKRLKDYLQNRELYEIAT